MTHWRRFGGKEHRDHRVELGMTGFEWMVCYKNHRVTFGLSVSEFSSPCSTAVRLKKKPGVLFGKAGERFRVDPNPSLASKLPLHQLHPSQLKLSCRGRRDQINWKEGIHLCCEHLEKNREGDDDRIR